MMQKSGSVRAASAALSFNSISASEITSLPSKMAAAFGRDLVFDMDRGDAGALELAYAAHQVYSVAVAGVGVGDDRNIDCRDHLDGALDGFRHVTRPMSGMPMLRATAPPLRYAASKPASWTSRADRPSKQPGATRSLLRLNSCLRVWRGVMGFLQFPFKCLPLVEFLDEGVEWIFPHPYALPQGRG